MRSQPLGRLLFAAALVLFSVLILMEVAGEIGEEVTAIVENARRDIRIDVARLAVLAERAGMSNPSLVQELVAESATDERVLFTLVTAPDDRILFSSRMAWLGEQLAGTVAETESGSLAAARETPSAVLHWDGDSSRMTALMHYHRRTPGVRELRSPDRGVAVVAYDLSSRIAIARETAVLSRLPVFIFLLVVLAAGLLLLFRFVTRPLARLREAARRVADGDFSTRMAEEGPLEVRDLARTFNAMTAQIGDLLQRQEQQSADLRAALAEKDLLLREVHHRVKNNLQIIVSLLHFHAGRLRHPEDERVFDDIRDRLRAMTLVHNLLYRSGDLARVDAVDYVRQLLGELGRSNPPAGMTLGLDIDDVPLWLPADILLPLGMLLNELVTNAIKHASPDGRPVSVRVSLHRARQGHIVLRVEDDGVGLRIADGRPVDSSSFGLKLIRSLATQVGATLTYHEGLGTQVEVVLRDTGDADIATGQEGT